MVLMCCNMAKIHTLNCQSFTHTFTFFVAIPFDVHPLSLVRSLARSLACSLSRSIPYPFGIIGPFANGRHVCLYIYGYIQQIDLPIFVIRNRKLVNNEIVTQATNSMCKMAIEERRKENLIGSHVFLALY